MYLQAPLRNASFMHMMCTNDKEKQEMSCWYVWNHFDFQFADDLYIQEDASSEFFGMISSDSTSIHHMPASLTYNETNYIMGQLTVGALKQISQILDFNPFKKLNMTVA